MLELALLCKFGLAYQTEWTFKFTGDSQYVYFYEGCKYEVQLWGANGGKGYDGSNAGEGGVGAYIRGIIKLSKSQNMLVRVGEAGADGWGGRGGSGGYNGGAKGGDDSGDSDDPPGGGGGATDIGFIDETRIAAAAGGSGGACGNFGAPGAGLNEHGDLVSGPKVVFGTDGGTGTRNGTKGEDSNYCPGSGGSGGWVGGMGAEWAYSNPYKAVAYSGSSGYLEQYMSQVIVKRGNDPTLPSKPERHGYAIVKLTNPDDVTCRIPRPSRSLTSIFGRGSLKNVILIKRGKIIETIKKLVHP